ncbi:MAG: hypothetical protein WCO02_08740 [Bacteroidota bacterium]
MKKIFFAFTFISLFLGGIFYSCSKDRNKSTSEKGATIKSIPDSLTGKSQIEQWFLNNIVRDTISINGNVLKNISLGQIDNEKNIIQLQEIAEDDQSTMINFFKELISQKRDITKDSIEIDTCTSCNNIENFPHFGPFWIIYNNLRSQNNNFIPIKNQIIDLDFHYIVKNGFNNPLHRKISLWLNVTENGAISFGSYMFQKTKSASTAGISITSSCDATTEYPCGCCTYYYAHWYSITRTCDCHNAGQGGCNNGGCSVSFSLTITL